MGCKISKKKVQQVSFVRKVSGKHTDDVVERKRKNTLTSSTTSKYSTENSSENSKKSNSSLTSTLNKKNSSVCLYNASTADSNKKDQDRFITVPNILENVFFTAVFDGHGQNGAIFAERAGMECVRLIQKKMKWLQDFSDSSEQLSVQSIHNLTVRATTAFTAVFADVQKNFTTEYNKEVKIPLERERTKLEKLEGIDLPVSLPMLGGTTATIVLVVGSLLLTCWVGDSRAVLCRVVEESNENNERSSEGNKIGQNTVTAIDLTIDHNVESNEKEKYRAIAAGGAIAGRHVAVDGADGMLQTLRSLGDVPHHTNDIVSSVPEINITQLNPNENPFVVLASDGIWHHRTSNEVVQNIFNELNKIVYNGKMLDIDDLSHVCRSYEYDLNDWVKANSKYTDDIVMSIFTINGFDWRKSSRLIE
jgi:serine/threonine protein phosphatase PrpC